MRLKFLVFGIVVCLLATACSEAKWYADASYDLVCAAAFDTKITSGMFKYPYGGVFSRDYSLSNGGYAVGFTGTGAMFFPEVTAGQWKYMMPNDWQYTTGLKRPREGTIDPVGSAQYKSSGVGTLVCIRESRRSIGSYKMAGRTVTGTAYALTWRIRLVTVPENVVIDEVVFTNEATPPQLPFIEGIVEGGDAYGQPPGDEMWAWIQTYLLY